MSNFQVTVLIIMILTCMMAWPIGVQKFIEHQRKEPVPGWLEQLLGLCVPLIFIGLGLVFSDF